MYCASFKQSSNGALCVQPLTFANTPEEEVINSKHVE